MIFNVSITLIKELRARTNRGLMECKKALMDANGDIQIAIDNMRTNGIIKAINKLDRITKEGIILIKIAENKKSGVIIELNCETDFTSKNDKFKKFGNMLINDCLKKKITKLDELKNEFEKEQNTLIAVLDENVDIRRMDFLEGETIAGYLHNNKIGVLVSAVDIHTKNKLLKHIAMHIAANKPEYIDTNHIPLDVINHEKKIQMNIAMKSNKSHKIEEQIIEGRMNKFLKDMTLMNQPFIMDTKIIVKNLLNKNNVKIKKFIRFALGENVSSN